MGAQSYLEFGVALVQSSSTTGATVGALVIVLVIDAGTSAFGSLLAENAELDMKCEVADVI